MRIAAHRGNQFNAPENTLNALISAYTSGADVLEFDIQLTKDHQLVLSHDGTVNRLCGLEGPDIRIYDKTLHELRWDSLDFSKTFNPNHLEGFRYYRTARRGQIEILPALLDRMPREIEKLIELKHDSSDTTEKREVFVQLFAAEIRNRGMVKEVVIYSKDKQSLRLLREELPGVRTAVFDWQLSPDEQLALLLDEQADGLVTDLESVLADGQLTDLGRKLQQIFVSHHLRVGAILYPFRKPGTFTQEEFEALSPLDFVWSVSTDTTLQARVAGQPVDLSAHANPSYTWLQDDLASNQVDRDWFALGYAKANPYCFVDKGNGVHINLEPYNGFLPKEKDPDQIQARLDALELRMLYAERSWPFYSGGGLGVIRPIEGDFCATVDYELARPLSQAQTLEMAVTNVDPARHRGTKPESSRDADAFFDPHGCPPYVGVEHDEDDGYRINWNLGAAYDNNQYGPPIGDGKTPLRGTLRLERRGDFFSAYYKNEYEAPDWICVGVVKNQSMNESVYLRCVAKRWLQEREDDPSRYYPVQENRISFRNLFITKPVGNRKNLQS